MSVMIVSFNFMAEKDMDFDEHSVVSIASLIIKY